MHELRRLLFLSSVSLPPSLRPSLHPHNGQTAEQHSSSAPCQSICIVACRSHCCGRQRRALSGITQLDGGHWPGRLGSPGRTKTGPDAKPRERDRKQILYVCLCVSAGCEQDPKFRGFAHLFTRRRLCSAAGDLRSTDTDSCCTKEQIFSTLLSDCIVA